MGLHQGGKALMVGWWPSSKDCIAGVCEQRRAGYSCTGCRGLVLEKDSCALQCSLLDSVSYAYARLCC